MAEDRYADWTKQVLHAPPELGGRCAVAVAGRCGPGSQPAATTAPASAPTTAAKPTSAPAASPATAASPSAAAAPSVSINGPFPGEAKSLNGAGATFPAPLYQKWFDEYSKLTQVQVNYQPIGSGGGIKGLQDQTIDFGASDAPMTDEQIQAAKGGEVFHIPTALGAIVATYNLPNVNARLKFTGDTIAGIFLGDIQKWNDPKLVADNPDLANVNQDIVVVHRSDGSGTTFGFTDYLSTANKDWQQKVGKGTSVNWPVGLGGSGNPGVAGEVQQNPQQASRVSDYTAFMLAEADRIRRLVEFGPTASIFTNPSERRTEDYITGRFG